MTEADTVRSDRPKLLGPKRRWLVLLVWGACLATVAAGQLLTVGTFPTGYRTIRGETPATPEEKLWYRLPPLLILGISAIFWVAAKWLIPERGTRGIVRAWGFFLAVTSLVWTFLVSRWYALAWYWD